MIARLQRWVLAWQLAIAAAVAGWLGATGRLPPEMAVAAGIAVPLGLHVSILTLDFGLAGWARGTPATDGPARGRFAALRDWVVAWAREIPDSLRTFSIAQPLLAARPVASAAAATPGRIPVLLLHGYFCNHALWRPMAHRLAQRGHAVAAIDLEPPFASIDAYAPQVRDAVEALRARTGATRVALVGHSMGGLAARAYLRACGDEAIACVVTLGTPHRGTVHAALGRARNVRQMRRDSEWLQRLAADEPVERRRRFTVVLSCQDNIVAPQSIQTLPDARTVRLHGLGHLSLAYDARVAGIVEAALDDASRAT